MTCFFSSWTTWARRAPPLIECPHSSLGRGCVGTVECVRACIARSMISHACVSRRCFHRRRWGAQAGWALACSRSAARAGPPTKPVQLGCPL
eukprot:11000614-Alexandrium_andersonii.AAC.1